MLRTVLIGFALCQSSFGQHHAERDDWWLNVPSSPLRFERLPNARFVTLTNVSTGRVVRYQLGCVRRVGERYVVVDKLQEVPTDLSPREGHPANINGFLDEEKRCNAKRSRVSAVFATFADGATWRAR